jgi:hypothetical protein
MDKIVVYLEDSRIAVIQCYTSHDKDHQLWKTFKEAQLSRKQGEEQQKEYDLLCKSTDPIPQRVYVSNVTIVPTEKNAKPTFTTVLTGTDYDRITDAISKVQNEAAKVTTPLMDAISEHYM